MRMTDSAGHPRGPFLPTPAPWVVEMLANGSFEDKILPANEMRRLIRLPVGLCEPDTSGRPGCVRGWEFARLV